MYIIYTILLFDSQQKKKKKLALSNNCKDLLTFGFCTCLMVDQ